MTKRILIAFALAAVAIAPFAHGFAAGEATDWTSLSTTKSWEYDDYRVSRLSGSSNDLKKFGETLVLVKRAEACNGSCDLRDLLILSNGGAITVSNVPTDAVDPELYIKNDNRLVYAEFSNDAQSRVNVIEVDLSTGQKTTLLADKFITDADEVKIMVDGDMIYASATFNHSKANDFDQQSMVFVYNPRYDEFRQMYHQWDLQFDELVDAQDNRALVKMTFDSGEEQLWVYDYVEFGEQEGEAVPGSWTVANENIIAPHFTSDGSIEYFSQFARRTIDKTLTNQSVADTAYLSWFRTYDPANLTNLVQVVGDAMAWVDSEDYLYVSVDGGITKITQLSTNGTFKLLEDRIVWSDGINAGGVAELDGDVITTLSFMPSDTLNAHLVVGTDATGDVKVMNIDSGKEMTLGFGIKPFVSDSRHVYWKGEDGAIYQATLYISTALDTADGTPVKASGDPKVYLLRADNTLSYIPNESVYYTWFDSFADVQTVSVASLANHVPAEPVGFKPGTKLRIDNGSKIYVVGSDGDLHWLVSEAVAKTLYGSDWNQKIFNVSSVDVLNDSYGTRIESGNDLAQTVMIATIE